MVYSFRLSLPRAHGCDGAFVGTGIFRTCDRYSLGPTVGQGIKSTPIRYCWQAPEPEVTASEKARRFQAIVLPHIDSAFNLARWLARSEQDAEDIVQEAYLRAFKFFDGFHGDDGRPWLLTIVRNTFYTWYQQNKAQKEDTEFDEEVHSGETEVSGVTQRLDNDPEALLIQKDARRQLERGLKALSPEFREVLVMRELEELSYKEIAGIVGIPIGTVMSRLARGRKQLAESLVSTSRVHDGP